MTYTTLSHFGRTLAIAGLVSSGALFSTASMAETAAQQAKQDFAYYTPGDGSHRINMSGKLRMLSQRIPGMACNQVSGIEPIKSFENLEAANAEFNRILAALEFGDDDLKITSEEENRVTLSYIAAVHAQWDPFEAVVTDVLADQMTEQSMLTLAESSGPLLGEAVDLVQRIVGVYYDPVTTLQSDAITIDFAGRQRMLAQRMSKNVCLINMGVSVEAATAELAEAYRLFDATLAALQVGMPTAGVSPPPNDAVVAGLEIVVDTWDGMAPYMRGAIDGETFDTETRIEIFNGLNTLTAHMNTVVGLYSDATVIGGQS